MEKKVDPKDVKLEQELKSAAKSEVKSPSDPKPTAAPREDQGKRAPEPEVEKDNFGSPVKAVDKDGNPLPNASSVRNSEGGTVQKDDGSVSSRRPVENTPNAKSTARTEAAKETGGVGGNKEVK